MVERATASCRMRACKHAVFLDIPTFRTILVSCCITDSPPVVGDVACSGEMTDDGLDERGIVMNGPVMLPWAEREKEGALRASLRTVGRGLLFPSRTFQITEAAPSGRAFFFYAFGIGCCIPMTLLSLVCIHAKYINPDLFHFQDVNPLTTLVAIPLQMVVGPLVIWLLGWCLFAAAKVVSAATMPARDTVRNLGWYVGTVMLFVVYTWLGIMVPLYSIRAWSSTIPVKL